MSNALVVYDDHQLNIIKSTVAHGTSQQEFDLFIQVCLASGLNPFARQIYAVMREEWTSSGTQRRMTIQTGIDGYRLLAQRSGKYRGQTKVEWCDQSGTWVDVWLDEKPPAAARVGVYHADYPEPIYAVATYKSYAARKKDGSPMAMWAKMPDVMLAKCAESLALRKAFPAEMSGIYTAEEMTQADSAIAPTSTPTVTVTPIVVESEPEPSPAKAQSLKVVKPAQKEPDLSYRLLYDAGIKKGLWNKETFYAAASAILSIPVNAKNVTGLSQDKLYELLDYIKEQPDVPPATVEAVEPAEQQAS